jgi:hypothetical protein
MTRRQTVTLSGVGLLIIGLGTTCGGDKSGPTGPTILAPTAPIAGFSISGQGALADVGQTTQLTATVTRADGTAQNVTTDTTWSSSDTAVVTVSDSGVMTAIAFGVAGVTASYRGQHDHLDVRVLPSGSFILTGSITEPVDVRIDEARVAVTGGDSAGPRSTIAEGGFYRFIGVSGAITVTASRSGYASQERSVTMSQDRTVNLQLAPNTKPAQISGTYRLTFTASSSCSGELPTAARKRTYTAAVRQAGAAVDVTLSGADFVMNTPGCDASLANSFSGVVRGNRISFDLQSASYYFYSECYRVAEQLEPDVLGILGDAEGTTSGSNISGNLAGRFDIVEPHLYRTRVTCSADNHQFTFVK